MMLHDALRSALIDDNIIPLQDALSLNAGSAFTVVGGVLVRIWYITKWRIQAGPYHTTITPENLSSKLDFIKKEILS